MAVSPVAKALTTGPGRAPTGAKALADASPIVIA
jgi:hypothetical protein